MAQQSFGAAVSAWVAKSERRLEMVFKESAQRVIAEAQDNAPVDTGYLRSSLQASINAPRAKITFRPPSGNFAYDASPVVLTIVGAKLGDTIYAVYSANYAPYVHAKNPWVTLAAQRWPAIVSEVCREARSRIR